MYATQQTTTHTTTLSRVAVGGGAVTLVGATGYMNVSAWVAQGTSLPEKIVNGCISGSLEAVGAAGLAWAGYQISQKRPLRGILAAAAAAGAIYFNTGASQNYYAAQDAAAHNQIEASGQTTITTQDAITRLETELAALIEQNDGKLPRPLPVIDAAYSHLDPDANPINMARKATEEGLRNEYERLQAEIAKLRTNQASAAILANDQPNPVIPQDQRLAFIWAVEAFKGGRVLSAWHGPAVETGSCAPEANSITAKSKAGADARRAPTPPALRHHARQRPK